MNPGQLNQRLTFFYMEEGTNDNGYPTNVPVTYLKAWASLQTLRGNRFYDAASSQMEHNREFTIRYRQELNDDLRPSDLKVKWRGTDHEIESIENDDGLNKSMTVIVKAVT